MRKQVESQHQKALFQWIRLKQNEDKRYSKIFAVPNGGKRDIKTATNLKLEGVKAGVWDIFIPIPHKGFSGMFIEMKANNNKLTKHQKAFRDGLEELYNFEVCYNWLEAKEVIESYLRK